MIKRAYGLFVISMFFTGCTLLYDVSTDVKLRTISSTNTSVKQGRTTIWLENKFKYDIQNIYYDDKDVYTIQSKHKGKLYSLHGITKKLELFDEDYNALLVQNNLKRVSLLKKNKYFSYILLDDLKLYLTVSKRKDELIYEYSEDMEAKEVKGILLAKKRKQEKKEKSQKLKKDSSSFMNYYQLNSLLKSKVYWSPKKKNLAGINGYGTVSFTMKLIGKGSIYGEFKDGVLISKGDVSFNAKMCMDPTYIFVCHQFLKYQKNENISSSSINNFFKGHMQKAYSYLSQAKAKKNKNVKWKSIDDVMNGR